MIIVNLVQMTLASETAVSTQLRVVPCSCHRSSPREMPKDGAVVDQLA